MTVDQLINQLEQQFIAAKDAANADKMSAYMKGLFFYYGIPAPKRQIIQQA
ncbi:MAG: hypothetical protein ACI865_001522 [Flavobacteriaceae bacterium]|jgi:hypothetical protein